MTDESSISQRRMRLRGTDDACLLMQAGLLWPWHGHLTPGTEAPPLLQPLLFRVSKLRFVLWRIKCAGSLKALAELRLLSAQAPVIVWCTEFLARAWSSLLAFQAKKIYLLLPPYLGGVEESSLMASANPHVIAFSLHPSQWYGYKIHQREGKSKSI